MSGFLTYCLIPALIIVVLPVLLFRKRKNPALLRILAFFCIFFIIGIVGSYTLIAIEAFGSYDSWTPEVFDATCGTITSSRSTGFQTGQLACLESNYYWLDEQQACSNIPILDICIRSEYTRSEVNATAERRAKIANDDDKSDDQSKYLKLFAVPLFFFGLSFAIVYFGRRNHPTMPSRNMFKRSPIVYEVPRPANPAQDEKPLDGYRVFISYSRTETSFAQRLGADLRQNGIDTWRDAENIPAGKNWDREVEKSIEQCTHLILVATPAAVQSENVQDELSLALNKGKTIIPIMVQTCDLPLRVHRIQWLDFRTDYRDGLVKLLTYFK